MSCSACRQRRWCGAQRTAIVAAATRTYMQKVIDNLAGMPPGGRNAALNGAAWTLGRRITADALEQADVEDELYTVAEHNGLVVDDGDRQCWATIRSGLSAGLQQPNDLDADSRPERRPRARR